MKDALGHGSDPRGTSSHDKISHQSGVQKVGRKFGEMMRDQSGAGKVPHGIEHAVDKLHDPVVLAHLASEMAHPELKTLAHMLHIFL